MAQNKAFQDVPIRRVKRISNVENTSWFEMTELKKDGDNLDVIVEPHRHDYYHIMYIKHGVGEHHIDFKTFEITPESFFFVSPGQVHALEVSPDVEGYVLTFNSGFYQLNVPIEKHIDIPFFHSVTHAPVVYLPEEHRRISSLLEELFEEYNVSSATHQEEMIRTLLRVLLIRISRVYNELPPISGHPTHLTEQLRKLDYLIDTHFKTYKLLNDYASLMHISPKHLNSLCKKGLNKTVTNLIHERTLTEARRLLLFTSNSVSEIAFELGFTDKSYFMRFFKKHMGLTADTYRHQHKTK